MATLTYNKEIVDKMLDEFSEGATITKTCIKYKVPRSTLWDWSNADVDGLKARYKKAKFLHDHATIDEIKSLTAPDSPLISYDEKGRRDTSLVRIAVDSREKYLRFRNKALTGKSEHQIFGVDLSECKKAADVQKIITARASKLTKSQMDTLLTLYSVFMRGEEQGEMRKMLEEALVKLNKLESK